MKGKQNLTRSEDFDRVYRKNTSWASKLLVLRAAGNDLGISRYGYSISKRVGSAVVRNLIRRRLREIMRRMPVKPGWDIVFIVRGAAAEAGFSELKKTVADLLSQARLLDIQNEIYCLNSD